jgi:hypothetical protein
MGRYLAAHISPMTLPMENNIELFLDTINIRATQADQMGVLR